MIDWYNTRTFIGTPHALGDADLHLLGIFLSAFLLNLQMATLSGR